MTESTESMACIDGYDWCPGPDAEDPEPGAAWGGKCSTCCLEGGS